ncbi:hypothetical protein ACS0TY_022013 [Phlomoides rotata]
MKTAKETRSRCARHSTSSDRFHCANRSAASTSERMSTPSTVMAGGRASSCPLTTTVVQPTLSSSNPCASNYFFRSLNFDSTVSGSMESGSYHWRTKR